MPMTHHLLPARADHHARAAVQRFDPRLRTVNFPRPMMASVVTTGADSLRVTLNPTRLDQIAAVLPRDRRIVSRALYAAPAGARARGSCRRAGDAVESLLCADDGDVFDASIHGCPLPCLGSRVRWWHQ